MSLKQRFLGAAVWTVGGHGGGLMLRLAGSLVMTRLLVPEMFGVMAVAATVTAITSMMSDVGIRQAVIQSANGDSREMLDTAWLLQILRGFVIWGIAGVVAAMLAAAQNMRWIADGSVYASPELPAVVAAVALNAVITGFQSTKAMTAHRHLQLRRLTVIELIGQLVTVVAMILLGWATRSIWSLVLGGLIGSFVMMALSHLWLRGIPNRFGWDSTAFREIYQYGRWVVLSSSLAVFAIHGDRLLLGIWVDAATLGFYVLALNLMMMVEDGTGRLFQSVAMPALSETRRNNPEKLREVYSRIRLPFDLALLGGSGILAAIGPSLVGLLYDPRYAMAGDILAVIAIGLVFSRFGLGISVLLALGETKKLVTINIVRLAMLFIGVPLGYSLFGLWGAIWAIALHRAPLLPTIWILLKPHRLHSVRYEMLILGTWPVAYGSGYITVSLLS